MLLRQYHSVVTCLILICSFVNCIGQPNDIYYKNDLEIIKQIHRGNYIQAKKEIDSFLSLPNLSQFHRTLFKSRYGLYHTIKGNQDSALQILLPLYTNYKDTQNLELLGDICSYIGRAYLRKNDNLNTIKFFNESISTHRRNNFTNYLGASNCFLGYYLLKCNLLHLADETMHQGMEFAIKDTNQLEYRALLYLDLMIHVRSNINKNQIDSAQFALEKFKIAIQQTNSKEYETDYFLYNGEIMLLQQNYLKALTSFEEAHKLSLINSQFEEKFEAILGITKSQVGLHRYNEALSILEQIKDPDKNLPVFISSKINHELYSIYSALGDDANSVKFLKRYSDANERLQKNNFEIILLQTQSDKNSYQKEILLKEHELTSQKLKQQNTTKIGLTILLILITLFLILALWAYKSRQSNLQKLTAYSSQLEKLNTEIEWKNKTLNKTNKTLLNDNESLQNFAFMAAHDLKGPLTGLFLYLQLIQQKSLNFNGLPDYVEKYVQKALEEGKRLETLIQDLLTLSKVGSDLGEPDLINLNDVIHHIIEIHQPIISSNDARVLVKNSLPKLYAHHNMLESLFQNLILNSIKYKHPERNPEIIIDSYTRNNYLYLTVNDNGSGIDKEHHKNIFKAFVRVRKDIEGTGLGLNTCKRIVEYYHGRIFIKSTVNEGTTFTIAFPSNTTL
jgi:signal transduction histidine kinase